MSVAELHEMEYKYPPCSLHSVCNSHHCTTFIVLSQSIITSFFPAILTMLPTKVLFALTMLVAGSVAMANADSDEATSVDPYIEPTESGNVVAVIDSDEILSRDTDPDAEAELFERKPCKCRRVSHHICWFVI